MEALQTLLERSAQRHSHLCPRQVLGVRMGMLAGELMGLDLPQKGKRLFTFSESDGCGTGGISVATGCWIDRRTLKVMDFGKLAATFVDTHTNRAIRIKSHPANRERAQQYAPGAADSWQGMLDSYQIMPERELFIVQAVQLNVSMEKIISKPGLHIVCNLCGEEISNEREVWRDGIALCCYCAGQRYYILENGKEIQADDRSLTSATDLEFQGLAKNHIPVVTIIGKSGAGKTTCLEKLITELRSRGYQIATVKHHSHSGFEIDQPGKDSWRHAKAGSCHTVIAAPEKIASYRSIDRELTLNEIIAGIRGVDIILVEGYKQAGKPTLEIVRSANTLELISSPEQRLGVIADVPLNVRAPQFNLDDIIGIANMIEDRFLQNGHGLAL